MEVCEDEEKKFFRGEQSLHELCVAVDCTVKPSAQSVAEYVSSWLNRYNVIMIKCNSLVVESD